MGATGKSVFRQSRSARGFAAHAASPMNSSTNALNDFIVDCRYQLDQYHDPCQADRSIQYAFVGREGRLSAHSRPDGVTNRRILQFCCGSSPSSSRPGAGIEFERIREIEGVCNLDWMTIGVLCLASLFTAVFLSGVFGLIVSRVFARRLGTRDGDVLYGRIPRLRFELHPQHQA